MHQGSGSLLLAFHARLLMLHLFLCIVDIAKAGETVEQLTGLPDWAADAAFAALFGALCFSGEAGMGPLVSPCNLGSCWAVLCNLAALSCSS